MKSSKLRSKASEVWMWLFTTAFESFVAFSLLLIFLGFASAYMVFSIIDVIFKPRMKK